MSGDLSQLTQDELDELANIDATPRAHRVSLIYGDQGKRKTTTAVSMVKERGLLLSSDDSWKVLLNNRHSSLYDRVKGNIRPITGFSQLDYIDLKGYDTIIWDTISESIDNFIDLLYDRATWGGKYRDNITINREASKEEKDELKGLQILAPMDYRVTRDKFRPAFNRLLETDAHLIFTSQVNEPVRGMSADMKLKPAIPNATFKVIARRCDVIGYVSPGTKNFTIDMTENVSSFLGKSRIEGLEGKMDLDGFVSKYKEIVFS